MTEIISIAIPRTKTKNGTVNAKTVPETAVFLFLYSERLKSLPHLHAQLCAEKAGMRHMSLCMNILFFDAALNFIVRYYLSTGFCRCGTLCNFYVSSISYFNCCVNVFLHVFYIFYYPANILFTLITQRKD